MYDCNSCARTNCAHRNAYRRLPHDMGGLGLCPGHINLNAINWSNPYMVKITPNPGCLVVRTNCAIMRRTPDKRRTYSVQVRDGEREASFITDGSDRLTAEDFVSGTNANGHHFFGYKHDLKEAYAQHIRKNAKIYKAEKADMIGFVLDCLEVPVIFADEGSKTYLV